MNANAEDDMPWWHDVRVDVVAELLEQALLASMVAEVDLPHIVVCTHRHGVSYTGPYSNGLVALRAAEQERRMIGNDDSGVRFGVAPICAPAEVVKA